jgi:hypothetical protein
LNEIHKEHPPLRKTLDLDEPITQSKAAWILSLGASIESIKIARNTHDLCPQMLRMAADKAPRLRDLHIRGDWLD